MLKSLLPLTRIDAFSVSGSTNTDIKGWLANQNYHVDKLITHDSFILRPYNEDLLLNSLANDTNSKIVAALETVSGIQPDKQLPNSSAWAMIRMYYAAFFSAHAILRLFGEGCSQIDNDHTRKILEVVDTYGYATGADMISKGLYHFSISDDTKQITFKKLKDSHRDTWKAYVALLDSICCRVNNLLIPGKAKIELYDSLKELKLRICKHGKFNDGTWLSSFRNRINYQIPSGPWFPYGKHPINRDYIQWFSENWKKIQFGSYQDKGGNESKLFVDTCTQIVNMMIEIFHHIVYSCDIQSKTIKNGCKMVAHLIYT